MKDDEAVVQVPVRTIEAAITALESVGLFLVTGDLQRLLPKPCQHDGIVISAHWAACTKDLIAFRQSIGVRGHCGDCKQPLVVTWDPA